ncbi:MAG: ribosomal L7Ae/L30e/S12e/Gadd45 family protein [Negativicutes bacterium]|nr:ribosomal L7Ae/L30e/S12e/Gadd45 family protein [Negativicutes bacterium]
MMNQQRLLALLGMAQKARKLVSGELAVEKAVRSGQAKLILIATDASESTRKSYRDSAAFYQVAFFEVLSKDEIGHAIGRPPRAALAVTDNGFRKAITELLRD